MKTTKKPKSSRENRGRKQEGSDERYGSKNGQESS